MFVSNIKTVSSKPDLKKIKKKNSDVGFSGFLSEAEEVSATSNVKSAGSLTSAVMLQEISQDEYQKKQNYSRGSDILDDLEKYNKANLAMKDQGHQLTDIAIKLKQAREKSSDPLLESLIDDVELRAAVEAAKKEVEE